ncbi:MAG TPA: RNA polymerase sigma factor [Steroidobacteraceae bacterium]|nr:RNA polymerase sigma factor [Steroidobacteraceae bacterium]
MQQTFGGPPSTVDPSLVDGGIAAVTKPERTGQIQAWADEWHGDLVKFLSRRTTTAADAQDLAQEVYLRLLRVERLDLIRQPRSYLLRIAANLLYEWRLKAPQARPHDIHALDVLAAADDPEADAIRERRAQRVAAELQRLTPTARVALVLQVREGLSYEEIAVRMNASRRMVKRYLLEAYAQLRARMPPDI